MGAAAERMDAQGCDVWPWWVQVSARQGELLNAMFEDREESTPRQHLAPAL